MEQSLKKLLLGTNVFDFEAMQTEAKWPKLRQSSSPIADWGVDHVWLKWKGRDPIKRSRPLEES